MKHIFEAYASLPSIATSEYINFLYQLDKQEEELTHPNYEIKTPCTTQEFMQDKDIDLCDDHFHLIKDGWIFDILLTRHQEKKLFVLFGGARTLTQKNLYSFSRWSYFPFMAGNVLSIVDPMFYKFPNLELGWYYGTKDYCLLQTISIIIKKIQHQLQISDNDVMFIGSSGGGYAALEISKYFTQTTHLAINPQLRIGRHLGNTNFKSITGIDLEAGDPYGRNATDDFLVKNKDCEYIIVQNARDASHCIEQLFPFLQKKGISTVNLGINHYSNITLWLYNCLGKDHHAHNYVGDQFTFSLMLLLQHVKSFPQPFLDFLYKNISFQLHQKSTAEALNDSPRLLFGGKSRGLRDWLLFFSSVPRDIHMEKLLDVLRTAQQECGQDPRIALAALRAWVSMWLSHSLPATAGPWRILPTCLSEILSQLPHRWAIPFLEKIRKAKPGHIIADFFLAWGYNYYKDAFPDYASYGTTILKKISVQEIPACSYGFAALLYLKYSLVEKIRPILYKPVSYPATLPAEIRIAFAAAVLSQKPQSIQYTLYNLLTDPYQLKIRRLPVLIHWLAMQKKGTELPQFFFPRQGYPLALTLYDIPLYFRNIQHARQCLAPAFPSLLAEARATPEYWQQTLAASRICRMEDNVALCAWEMFKLRLLTPRHMQELEADGFKEALAGLRTIINRFVKTHGAKLSS